MSLSSDTQNPAIDDPTSASFCKITIVLRHQQLAPMKKYALQMTHER